MIAHPDDETMFFGPTIRRLIRKGCQIHILCITSGDAEGLGTIRKRELTQAVMKLGIQSENLTILDMKDYSDGMKIKWEVEKLSRYEKLIILLYF